MDRTRREWRRNMKLAESPSQIGANWLMKFTRSYGLSIGFRRKYLLLYVLVVLEYDSIDRSCVGDKLT